MLNLETAREAEISKWCGYGLLENPEMGAFFRMGPRERMKDAYASMT
jgi:hypothetical protein